MRPATLPPLESYVHGTLARYRCGCRCEPCRAAVAAYMRGRDALAIAAAREAEVETAPVLRPQKWTRPDGTVAIRLYRRACPGVEGRPCPKSAHLRKDSHGGVCGYCRFRLPAVWNGLVSSERARLHLRKLSRMGVGSLAVSDACDVAHSILALIAARKKPRIRAQTERRILSVDAGAVADHALVDARPTKKLLAKLLAEGYPKARLAKLLGYRSPALQFRAPKVTARNALRVARLYRDLLSEVT